MLEKYLVESNIRFWYRQCIAIWSHCHHKAVSQSHFWFHKDSTTKERKKMQVELKLTSATLDVANNNSYIHCTNNKACRPFFQIHCHRDELLVCVCVFFSFIPLPHPIAPSFVHYIECTWISQLIVIVVGCIHVSAKKKTQHAKCYSGGDTKRIKSKPDEMRTEMYSSTIFCCCCCCIVIFRFIFGISFNFAFATSLNTCSPSKIIKEAFGHELKPG